MKKLWQLVAVFLVLLIVWQLICQAGIFNLNLFPSPVSSGRALAGLALEENLFLHIGASMYRFLIGYISAAVLAGILGLFLGYFTKIWIYLNPLVQFLRPISPIAWMPFIALWFGIGDVPAIIVIFIAAFFPILLSTISAIEKIDPVYFKVASNFGLNAVQTLFKIVFPSVFPQMMNGLHLAVGTAWIFLVAGEMIGTQSGLGFLIIDARNNLRTDVLVAAIAIIGILGLCLDKTICFLEQLVSERWGIGMTERRKEWPISK